MAASPIAQAAPADFDLSFGAGGKATLEVSANTDQSTSMSLRPDGRIVLAGAAYVQGPTLAYSYDLAVARFNSDGTPDVSFDGDGSATASVGSGRDSGRAVALQPDGKVVVAGDFDINPGSHEPVAVVRYNEDGSLETPFGGNSTGRVYFSFVTPGSFVNGARAVTIQPDGKILIAGWVENGGPADFALARLLPSGFMDPTFGVNGRVVTPIVSAGDEASAIVLQPDGKIVVAGHSWQGATAFDFTLVRYDPYGSLDASFDGDGIVTTDFFGERDQAKSIALLSDGSILAAGRTEPSGGDAIALAKYAPSGALDASFGIGGKVRTAVAGLNINAKALVIQNDGKVVLAGSADSGAAADFLVARYDATGLPDPTFDGDGMLVTRIASEDSKNDRAEAVGVQPDGRIVVGGYSEMGLYDDFALFRLEGGQVALPAQPDSATPPIIEPSVSIRRPSGKRLRNLKRFSGTAGPAGQVEKVELAVRRIENRALKRKTCLWLRGPKVGFKKVKAPRGRCAERRFLTASGTENWSFRLKRGLPRGAYEVFVRVTLKNGVRHTSFSAASQNHRTFRIK